MMKIMLQSRYLVAQQNNLRVQGQKEKKRKKRKGSTGG